jgi:hypothetical protein
MAFAPQRVKCAVSNDPWQQWRALTALWPPQTGASAPGSSGPFNGSLDSGERFASAARSLFETSRGSPANAAAAMQTFSEFLRDHFAGFFSLPTFGAPPGAASGAPLADAPALGLTREHQERLKRAGEALLRLEEAQRRLQRLWADTLREAAGAFAARLGVPKASPSPEDLHRWYDSWIDCAEEAYARSAHSEAFCDALADYVNASSAWRRESSAGVEQWAKLFDLPTRSEINSLTERLRAVETELLRQRVKPSARGAKPRKAKGERKP